MLEECENCEAVVLLGNFRWRVILSSQFTLLLFRLNLASSILSFVTGLRFVVTNLCLKNRYWLLTLIVPRLVCGRTLFGVRRFWSKNLVSVIYCNCFHAFV